MKQWMGAVLAAVVMGTASPAQAQPDDEFKTLVDEGMRAYKRRQYDAAINAFESAFAIRREPELIYNVARAYEKSLDSTKAIQTYERFLRLQGTTAELRAKALTALEGLRAERRALDRARREVAPPPPPAPTPAARGTKVPLEVRRPAPEPKSRALEWTLIGSGAAMAVAGGVFALLASMDNSDFDDRVSDGNATAEELNDIKDDVDRNALIADILIPTGLLAAGVGVLLFVVDPDEEEGMAVSPMVTGDGAGLAVGGRF